MTETSLNKTRDTIAGFLKDKRIERGMTQEQVAEQTGLARKTVNAMEAGKFWLGMRQYLLICAALEISPATPLRGL